MPEQHLPADSVDQLIAAQIPPWLTAAGSDALFALHRALHEQQAVAERMRQTLAGIAPLDAFAAPLLEQALAQAGSTGVDVRRAKVLIEQDVELPTAAPNLPRPRHTFHSQHAVLASALHNYSEDETRASIFRRARLVDAQGKPLALGFEAFARVCRQLDLGGRYQRLLKAQLQPPEGGREQIEQLFTTHQRLQLEVEVRMAYLKGGLDERSYLQMLPLFAAKPTVPAVPDRVEARQLYLLGRRIAGVVGVQVQASTEGPVQGVILFIPGDPKGAVTRHDGWDSLYLALAGKLRDGAYRAFFSRFIGQPDLAYFTTSLNRLLRAQTGAPLQLDGRHFPIEAPLARYLGRLRLDAIQSDARVLAVPTDDEDARSRRERLQASVGAAQDLLGLAGLFVPVLGEVMLAVAAVQVAAEVYEGYQAWSLGDRQAALEHMFNVAQSVVVGAVVGGVSQAAISVAQRVPFVDGLAPLRTAAGGLKLCHESLPGYSLVERELSVGQHLRVEGSWRVRTTEGAYRIEQDAVRGGWRILHPTRDSAHAPRLDGDAGGAWRHALESPQTWTGAGYLLRRMGGRLAEVDDGLGEALLQITGIGQEQLRRLHLESAPAPARLYDALERYDVHQQHPALRGEAFEGFLAERQVMPDSRQATLMRDFPGLTVRGAQEIIEQASSDQLDALHAGGRVPLALAEQARWYLRDSRLDRACAGLHQAQAINVDTERLALGLLDQVAPWPASLRIELRAGDVDGALLASHGPAIATQVQRIVRHKQGYQAVDGAGASRASLSDSLMQAVLLNLNEEQLQRLGGAQLTAEGLRQHLAAQAVSGREAIAAMLGMAPIGRGLRPPQRFADGRLGYALSGRAESSRQAFRRGIHQVFPMLTGMQLEAYVMDLMNRNVDLWQHYARLQDQLARLRASLQQWQGGWHNPLEAIRRRHVANAIRRSWRRKQVGLDGDFVLQIEGERVGSLPALPEDVEFGHVRRLVLRNMDLVSIDAGFLRRFANVVELDLRGNLLTEVPAGVEHLAQLRQLHLSRNQIVMDAQGSSRLAALPRLAVLDLDHNPLGHAPDLAGARHLRHLSLRATGLDALPNPLRQLSWRALADLRENRIEQLREDLRGLRQRVELQRLSLHDNPLDRQALETLSEVSSLSRSSSLEHGTVDDALLERLLINSLPQQRPVREALWRNLQQESQAADLLRFIADFVETEDFRGAPDTYRGRIWHILEACEQHESLRERAFTEAGGARTCEDRLLLIFSQLETALLAEEAVQVGPASQRERRLLRLGRALYRLDEVDRIAARHVLRMQQQGAALIDEIETRLFYRIKLTPSLGLPAQPDVMHYESFAGVSSRDLMRAEQEVLGTENPEVLVQSLAQRPFWERYVRERYAERFDALVAPFHQRLELLEQSANSGELVAGSEVLRKELEQAEQVLLQTLAREAYDRSQV